MRTTTKCATCRRRKQKCVHEGVPPCTFCKSKEIECELTVLEPNPVKGPTHPNKSTQSGAPVTYSDSIPSSSTKRLKIAKSIPVPYNGAIPLRHRQALDADAESNIDPSKYTPTKTIEVAVQRVIQLFPELPFLHKNSVLDTIMKPHVHNVAFKNSLLALAGKFAPLEANNEFLSPGSINVIQERYCRSALKLLLSSEVLLSEPKIEIVQSLLVLSLYEWISSRTFSGWMLLGNAIRMLQTMDLCAVKESPAKHKTDPFDREIKIRTFWSSFILDKAFSSGKSRIALYSKYDTEGVPLPKLQHEFDLMKPSNMNENGNISHDHSSISGDDNKYQGSGNNLGGYFTLRDFQFPSEEATHYFRTSNGASLLFTIRLHEIWGDIASWLAKGGRRQFLKYPWDPESVYYGLDRSIRVLIDLLPSSYIWNATNFSNHVALGTHLTYSQINILTRLCIIFIRREYIPFLPHSTVRPMGPQEEPILPVPPVANFWEISATELHDSGRELAEIVSLLSVKNQEVSFTGSHMVSFGCFTSAAVLLYANKFYWMDSIIDKSKTMIPLNKMIILLGKGAGRSEWELAWFNTIKQLQQLYDIVCSDLNRARRLNLGRNSFIKMEDSIQTVNPLPSLATNDLEKLNEKLNHDQKTSLYNDFQEFSEFIDTFEMNSEFFNGFLN